MTSNDVIVVHWGTDTLPAAIPSILAFLRPLANGRPMEFRRYEGVETTVEGLNETVVPLKDLKRQTLQAV